MATTIPNPIPNLVPTSTALHGPYEDAIIAGFKVMEKLIDGQTVEQKAKLWQNWIDFWQPFMEIAKNFSQGLLKGVSL
jgi:hypothetical protein